MDTRRGGSTQGTGDELPPIRYRQKVKPDRNSYNHKNVQTSYNKGITAMKAMVLKVSKEIPKLSNVLKDGEYAGAWSGYNVKVRLSKTLIYNLETDVGVRGLNIPCKVTIKDGKATVDTLGS
jgi:adenine specific DNA methylase Mod